jgi:hypothetical protein
MKPPPDEYCDEDVAVIGLGDGSVEPLRGEGNGPRSHERFARAV